MSRDRLRQAIQGFVDSLYETLRAELRAELLTELRAELLLSGGQPVPRPDRERVSPADPLDALVARIGAWVDEHPHATAGAIHEALGGTRATFYAGLRRAREEGRVVRTGTAPRVSYASPGVTEPARDEAPAHERPASSTGRTAIHRVVAFVQSRPRGCAPREMESLGLSMSSISQSLRQALAGGLVRKLGHGRAVMYFPPRGEAVRSEPPAAAASEPSPPPTTSPRAGSTLAAEAVAYVRLHPGCRYADLATATGASEGRLRVALSAARAEGALVLRGERIKARYFPGTDAAAAPVKAEAPSTATTSAPPRPVTVPPVAAEASPPAARAGAVRAAPVDTVVLDRAQTVLRELDEELAGDSHVIRLAAFLQAVVAEVRMLQPRVPDDHPLARRLDGAIRRVTAIRAERDLPFIVGLKRGATADWERLARDARQRVGRFDLDAEAAVPRRPSQRPPRATAPKPKANEVEVEALPHLTTLAAERPVVLVGGIKKNEVLDHVRRHHALDVEWVAMQGANARAAEALVDRIRHGNVGAVVMLEALTGTTQVKAVVAACKEAEVPFAYGGAAGTQTLRGALREIETGLGG